MIKNNILIYSKKNNKNLESRNYHNMHTKLLNISNLLISNPKKMCYDYTTNALYPYLPIY